MREAKAWRRLNKELKPNVQLIAHFACRMSALSALDDFRTYLPHVIQAQAFDVAPEAAM